MPEPTSTTTSAAEYAMMQSDPERAAIVRRRRMAEALVRDSQKDDTIRSNSQGFARLAQAALGSISTVLADRADRQLQDERQQDAQNWFGKQGLGAPVPGYNAQQQDAQPAAPVAATEQPAAVPPPPTAQPAGDPSLPRGLRNNNPLNIVAAPFTERQPGYQGSDGRFGRFASMDDGVRAADTLLQSYAGRGLNTPQGIVNRWAPRGDGANDPSAYAQSVSRTLGTAPDAALDMADPAVRRRLIDAMATVENGRPIPAGGPASRGTQYASAGGATPEMMSALTGGAPAPAPAAPDQNARLAAVLQGMASPNPIIRQQSAAMLPAMQFQIQQQGLQQNRAADNTRADAQMAEQRRQHEERMALERDRFNRGEVPTNFTRQPDGSVAPTRGGPADPDYLRQAGEARTAGTPRPLPTPAINRLGEMARTAEQFGQLERGFQPEYGGFGADWIGDTANAIGRNTPGASPRADWWQQYNALANVERNDLFGSALTASEQAAWRAAAIGPGMSEQAIRTNLARRSEIAQTAFTRYARSHAANGYNPNAISEASGLTLEQLTGQQPQRTPMPAAPQQGGGWSIRPVQ